MSVKRAESGRRAEPQDEFGGVGPVLVWPGPDGTERTVDLRAAPAKVTIGRRADSDVPLPWDAKVSRVHAVLERVGADWALRDDGLSRNGTWVNGERLGGTRRLGDGDVIQVGGTVLTVRAASAPDSLATVGTVDAGGAPAVRSARVVVNLCGALRLEVAGRRLDAQLSGRLGRRLFAYLVVRRAESVRRDELTEILWPRERPASPEAGLSVHLARLRRVLGDAAVVGRSDVRIDLGADAFVDVEAADRWLHEARRRCAAGLRAEAIGAARAAREVLAHEFLPEFGDDEWVVRRRTELGAMVADLLEVEAEAALALGERELPTAEAAAKELVEQRPYRESDHRLLMRAHAERGNVAEALLVYEGLRHRLMEDLGIPPAAETRALYSQLLARHGGPGTPGGPAGDA